MPTSEHRKDTAFLKKVMLYGDTAEHRQLEELISHAERDERCVCRAIWLVGLATAVGVAGLCYCAIFLAEFTDGSRIAVRIFCALGLASILCLPAFLGIRALCRKKLGERREECRRLAARVLEVRLGQPSAIPVSVGKPEPPN